MAAAGARAALMARMRANAKEKKTAAGDSLLDENMRKKIIDDLRQDVDTYFVSNVAEGAKRLASG